MFDAQNKHAENPVLLISIMFCNIMKSSRGKLRMLEQTAWATGPSCFIKLVVTGHILLPNLFLVTLSVNDPCFMSYRNSFVKLQQTKETTAESIAW